MRSVIMVIESLIEGAQVFVWAAAGEGGDGGSNARVHTVTDEQGLYNPCQSQLQRVSQQM